jgi:hypothetical protein
MSAVPREVVAHWTGNPGVENTRIRGPLRGIRPTRGRDLLLTDHVTRPRDVFNRTPARGLAAEASVRHGPLFGEDGMSTIEKDPRDVEVVHWPVRRGCPAWRLLLVCGVLSATLCVATDLLGGMRYPGYSVTSQALTTTGAPSEPLVDPLVLAYGMLALAFAVGVLRDRRLALIAPALPGVIPLISGLLLGALPGGVLEAQQRIGDTGSVRGEVGGTLFLATPVGEFDRYVGLGGGVSGFAALFFDETQTLGLRLDGSFMIYGDNTVRRPLSPTVPFVYVDVTTRNGIASFGLGPQVQLGQGPVRPLLRGAVGFSYFATTTSVEGTNDFEPFASSTNFDDWTFTLTGGGGLRIHIAQAGDNPIALDLGVTYVRNGETDYLREGGIREGPGGSVIIEPIRSETNLLTFHVGVAVGLR